jgi:hypothetical protein
VQKFQRVGHRLRCTHRAQALADDEVAPIGGDGGFRVDDLEDLLELAPFGVLSTDRVRQVGDWQVGLHAGEIQAEMVRQFQ